MEDSNVQSVALSLYPPPSHSPFFSSFPHFPLPAIMLASQRLLSALSEQTSVWEGRVVRRLLPQGEPSLWWSQRQTCGPFSFPSSPLRQPVRWCPVSPAPSWALGHPPHPPSPAGGRSAKWVIPRSLALPSDFLQPPVPSGCGCQSLGSAGHLSAPSRAGAEAAWVTTPWAGAARAQGYNGAKLQFP